MPTISCTTAFNLRTSPKVFIFTDTTDWAGQGINTADVNGCIDAIIPPSGIPYYNNADFSDAGCDIWINNALTNQIPITLPGGTFQLGTYTIRYKVYNSDTDEYYTQEYTFECTYVKPTLDLDQSADCLSPLFTSTDNTIYEIEGAELTLERTHKVIYPAGSVGYGSPIINTSPTNPVIATSVFYNGTQTSTIESEMEYVFEDGLIILDELDGSEEELVNCRDICAITCCIISFETRMNALKTTNYEKYLSEYKFQWLEIMGYIGMIKSLAIPCGVANDKISYFLEKIKEIGNCTDDCCTSGDNYSQVVGLGTINVVVATGGTPVEVTSVVASGTTTYTIALAAAFVAKVTASYNSVVAPGTGITVAVTTAPDGTKTYTVHAIGTSLSSTIAQNTTPFTVPAAVGTKVTGCTVTAPAEGMYLVLTEADFHVASKPGGTDAAISYRLLKNNVTAVTADRVHIVNIEEAVSGLDYIMTKLVLPAQVMSLLAGDVLDWYIDAASTGGSIFGRSITLVKVG